MGKKGLATVSLICPFLSRSPSLAPGEGRGMKDGGEALKGRARDLLSSLAGGERTAFTNAVIPCEKEQCVWHIGRMFSERRALRTHSGVPVFLLGLSHAHKTRQASPFHSHARGTQSAFHVYPRRWVGGARSRPQFPSKQKVSRRNVNTRNTHANCIISNRMAYSGTAFCCSCCCCCC